MLATEGIRNSEKISNLGAIIRIGFGRILYDNYNKEPPNIIQVIIKAPILGRPVLQKVRPHEVFNLKVQV